MTGGNELNGARGLKIAVIGGGISGLAAARLLARSGFRVTVFESTGRWGGKLAPVMLDGVRLDGGAESVLARRPEAVRLIDDLGLGGRRVHPTAAKPQLLIKGSPQPLPPSMMGVPTDLEALRSVLSESGFQAAQTEPERPAPALDHDLPIGRYVDQRFGAEVTDRLLEPLLGGVYAGDSRQLSFEAVAHALFQRARAGGSLLDHARDGARGGDGPVFAGLTGGVNLIIDALVAELEGADVQLRLGAPVRELQERGRRFQLTVGPASDPESIMADGVVLAAPARSTGRLLSGLIPAAAKFSAIPYASVAVVTMIIRGLDSPGSGLLVPRGGLSTIKAMTYSSNKWDWIGEQASTAWGAGTAIVRASIGRIGVADQLQLPDGALLDRTFAEARWIPGWASTELIKGSVSRWGGALPQYLVGHRSLIARLRSDLSRVHGVAAAGAALDGVGIAACLASAESAVDKIITDLAGTP